MTARAARFYGWAWNDIRDMPFKTLRRFCEFITELKAQEKLEQVLVTSFAHFEEKTRKEILRAWAYEAGVEHVKPRTRKVKDWRSWVRDMGAPAGVEQAAKEKAKEEEQEK